MWLHRRASHAPGGCLQKDWKMSWGEKVWWKRGRGLCWVLGGVLHTTHAAGLRPTVLTGTEWGEMKSSFLPQSVGTQNECESQGLGCTYSPQHVERKQMRVPWLGRTFGSILGIKKGQHHSDPWWERRKMVAGTWEVRTLRGLPRLKTIYQSGKECWFQRLTDWVYIPALPFSNSDFLVKIVADWL